MKQYRKVLTVAGSDSGGGAGIQADLKTISACGCYGMTAITAITAQNTCGIRDIHPVPPATIALQMRAVLEDIGTDAIKIGMLHSSEVIKAVTDVLVDYSCPNIIVDPVMVATSGVRLTEQEALTALKQLILPRATLITPNIAEAEILAGKKITDPDDMIAAAKLLSLKFSTAVLVKGGHLADDNLSDIFWKNGAKEGVYFKNRRIATHNSHGTGCTLSSAIASFIARGNNIEKSIELAEKYLNQAIASGAEYTTGKGHGPVNHFFQVWQ